MASLHRYGCEEQLLMESIEEEMRKVHTNLVILSNNQLQKDFGDPLEKALTMNACYSASLLNSGIPTEDDQNHNVESRIHSFNESLQQELNFLMNDLETLIQKINEFNTVSHNIDTNIKNLNLMAEAGAKNSSMKKSHNDLLKNIKLRFKKEKSDLKGIITGMFAENLDIQDLLAKIIEHHLDEGSDKFLQLPNEQTILEQIETLRRINLIEVHPNDALQIRLADLI